MTDLIRELYNIWGDSVSISAEHISDLSKSELLNYLSLQNGIYYQDREDSLGSEQMRTLERLVLLRAIDFHWVHHLTSMSELRQGIGLYGYGQRDPLVMYKIESRRLFDDLQSRIRQDVSSSIYKVAVTSDSSKRIGHARRISPKEGIGATIMSQANAIVNQVPSSQVASKIGRNEPCPCGSGYKFKKCHGNRQ